MLVYRVEDFYGNGPYNGINMISNLVKDHGFNSDYPGWSDDLLGEYTSSYKSGFISLDKLIEWFYNYFDELSKEFKISVYIDPHHVIYSKSGKQIAFYGGIKSFSMNMGSLEIKKSLDTEIKSDTIDVD